MAKYREVIPKLFSDPSSLFITEGGTETTLYYLTSFPLRDFCGFEILLTDDPSYSNWVYDNYSEFCDNACKHGLNVQLDLLTWRMSPHWIKKLGYDDVETTMRNITKRGMEVIGKLRQKYEAGDKKIKVVAGGEVGPRWDAYTVEKTMTVEESWRYHRVGIKFLVEGGVDVIMALTMTTGFEAAGIARACSEYGSSVVVSFTIELNGRLPDGESIREAIEKVEQFGTWKGKSPVLFYMLNCAHWELVGALLQEGRKQGETWVDKIKGLRANSSRKSHEELEAMTALDIGDPKEWGLGMSALRADFGLRVLGGCCGTHSAHQSHLVDSLAAQKPFT